MKDNSFKIRIFALLSLLIAASAAVSGKNLEFPGSESAQTAVMITDLATGNTIVSQNPDMLVMPASVVKALTTATALRKLGPDHQFETRVTIDGTRDGDSFTGRLTIYGGWDPGIHGVSFPGNNDLTAEIVEALQADGITNGHFTYKVESNGYDQGPNDEWFISEAGVSYATGAYAFNCYDNLFSLNLKNRTSTPAFSDVRVKIINEDSPRTIIRPVDTYTYIIKGKDINTNQPLNVAMNNPAEVYRYNLANDLHYKGYWESTTEQPESDPRLLFTHKSAELRRIARTVMVQSNNLGAESLLRISFPGQTLNSALESEMKLWKESGVDTRSISIYDGSGLSRRNAASARFISSLLSYMANDKDLSEVYLATFPVVGKDGTVKNFLKKTKLDGRLALKTGSLNGVQCYAGYKLDKNGHPTHTVVIMVNNFTCQRQALRKAITSFLLDTFKN